MENEMIRVCPHSDSKCPNGMTCTYSCATGDYDGTKRPAERRPMTDTTAGEGVTFYHEEIGGMYPGKALYEGQQEYVKREDYEALAAQPSAGAQGEAVGWFRRSKANQLNNEWYQVDEHEVSGLRALGYRVEPLGVIATPAQPAVTAADVIAYVRKWLDADDPTAWGPFERGLDRALKDTPAQPDTGEDEAEEGYKIGKDEGYEDAVRDIDLATGGDGEYYFSTDDGGCPDAATMKARIVERFNARQPDTGDVAALREGVVVKHTDLGCKGVIVRSVEGWWEVEWSDQSLAICRPSHLSALSKPNAPGAA